mmetsp:Transcript_40287/g.110897  ORF Transcript_40287/g.110897 Transcript_40287/m.110897 type:complete len:357 (+) Transcript_40287:742-1812(+)
MRTASLSGAPLTSRMTHRVSFPYFAASSAVSSSRSSSTSPAPTRFVNITIRVGPRLSFAAFAFGASAIGAESPRFTRPLFARRRAAVKLRTSPTGPASVKAPSAVIPTKPSPTMSKRSEAGMKAQFKSPAFRAAMTPATPEACSAVNNSKCRAASPSPAAHSATSCHKVAASNRSSLSVGDAAPSSPRGKTLEMMPRQRVAQAEAAPVPSSHLLFRRPSFIELLVHTLRRNRSQKSRNKPISGNCAKAPCHIALTQLSFLAPSAAAARFIVQRSCARKRLGMQSYAVRSRGEAKTSSKSSVSYHLDSKCCAMQPRKAVDSLKACSLRASAAGGIKPSPVSASTAPMSLDDSAMIDP